METTEERVLEPEDECKRYNVKYEGFKPPSPPPAAALPLSLPFPMRYP